MTSRHNPNVDEWLAGFYDLLYEAEGHRHERAILEEVGQALERRLLELGKSPATEALERGEEPSIQEIREMDGRMA